MPRGLKGWAVVALAVVGELCGCAVLPGYRQRYPGIEWPPQRIELYALDLNTVTSTVRRQPSLVLRLQGEEQVINPAWLGWKGAAVGAAAAAGVVTAVELSRQEERTLEEALQECAQQAELEVNQRELGQKGLPRPEDCYQADSQARDAEEDLEMTAQRWPRIRLYDKSGELVLREGLILCFVMNRSYWEVGPGVMRALDAYCRAIHPQRLELYPFHDDWRALDEAEWASTRQRLLFPSPRLSSHVHLVQSALTGGAYYFWYQGLDLERPATYRGRNDASSVFCHLPTEYLEEHGPGRVRALALEMAAELPFNFGYVSLAFLNPESYWYIEYERAREFCFRYPGLDLYYPGEFSAHLGTRARGAYWLTFLGQPLLNDLGGEEALRRRLPSPDISFQPLPGERLLLTLGEWPEAGDTQEGYVPPLYRELSQVLKTWLYLDVRSPWSGFTRGELRRWLRRYLR